MGTYLNPGKQSFQMAVNSEIYVDKTQMISYLNSVINTQQRFVSVSRPRRFGKTMAADMICAYYDREADSRELFEKRKLAQDTYIQADGRDAFWDRYLGKFDVIRMVMTDFISEKTTIGDSLSKLVKLVVRDLSKKYPDVDFFDKNDLIQSMNDVYAETNIQFVIVIDEWDAIFRVWKEDTEGQNGIAGAAATGLTDGDWLHQKRQRRKRLRS